MEKKRRFSRVTCDEKIIVQFNGNVVEAKLLDIALKGALVEFKDDLMFYVGDICHITFNLKNSDIVLQFRSEVVYSRKTTIGLKFNFIDVDSFIHLRRLIEARTGNPDLVLDEIDHLIEPFTQDD